MKDRERARSSCWKKLNKVETVNSMKSTQIHLISLFVFVSLHLIRSLKIQLFFRFD